MVCDSLTPTEDYFSGSDDEYPGNLFKIVCTRLYKINLICVYTDTPLAGDFSFIVQAFILVHIVSLFFSQFQRILIRI